MNPAFPIIVVLWLIAVWLISGRLYKPIGRVLREIFDGAFKAMFGTKENDKDERQ